MDKLIAVTDHKEIAALLAGAGNLDVPRLFGGDGHPYFTKADELRVWRASQSDTEGKGNG